MAQRERLSRSFSFGTTTADEGYRRGFYWSREVYYPPLRGMHMGFWVRSSPRFKRRDNLVAALVARRIELGDMSWEPWDVYHNDYEGFLT